jgi:glutamine amidotransferase-like uncharacterized protein
LYYATKLVALRIFFKEIQASGQMEVLFVNKIFSFVNFYPFFLLGLALCSLFPNDALAVNHVVYIYAGPGVSKSSLAQIKNTLNFILQPNYQILEIFPEQILHDDWETHTALLIIPGGADIPYARALDGIGNQKIRSYVENGGSFLGICAGGYYGGEFVEFAINTDLEVQGKRELGFFPGIVRGPVLAPYDYQSESGARAAQIRWTNQGFPKNTVFSVYFNGGGYFVDATEKKLVSVLASYDIEEEFAAIVECQVGSGKAILSGVHFEYDPDILDSTNDYLIPIIATLKNDNKNRIELVRHLLKKTKFNF